MQHGVTMRWVGWLGWLGWLALGCSANGGGAAPDVGASSDDGAVYPVAPASGEQAVTLPPGAPAGSSPYQAFIVEDLHDSAQQTAPKVISIVLGANADRIDVQVAIQDGDGRWLTPCSAHVVYRVGPSAQSWQLGAARSFALAHGVELPDGFYSQLVRVALSGEPAFVAFQYLEVADGGFRRVSSEEFSDAVLPTMIDGLGRPYVNGGAAVDEDDPAFQDPCAEPPAYTDAIDEGPWTRVDVDGWVGGMIQPLRWQTGLALPDGTRSAPELFYHLQDAAGAKLSLRVPVRSDEPAPIATTLGQHALTLEERAGPGEAPIAWGAIDGRVEVTPIEGGELRVELFDVLLDKSRMYTDPPVQRTLSRASIVGRWVSDMR